MEADDFNELIEQEGTVDQNRVLSFSEYASEFSKHPHLRSRNAVQYLRDALDYFGKSEIQNYNAPQSRFNAFNGQTPDQSPLIGLEPVQEEFYNIIDGLSGQKRPDRFIVIHGPNGSGKTTLLETLFSTLEAYSQTELGRLYRFNWIFPTDGSTSSSGSVGFRNEGSSPEDSYAHLNSDQIQSKITGQLSDHPLLILPRDVRLKVLERSIDSGDMPRHLVDGHLNPANKKIFNALLLNYDGDLSKVLRHVQVEQWTISARYRRGTAVVGPELHVDADVQQITLDENYKSLPSDLQHLDLSRVQGPIAKGNRGILAFEDFQKRNPQTNKYLLGTIEDGEVQVDNQTLQIDSLLVATVNQDNLQKWKRKQDYQSMRGRMKMVQMPYLLDYQREKEIYDTFLGNVRHDKHIAPHVSRFIALWAVTTRLRDPDFSDLEDHQLSEASKVALADMSGPDKACFYATGSTPKDTTLQVQEELKSHLSDIVESTRKSHDEGMKGVSPRYIQTTLQNTLRVADETCLTPSDLCQAIKDDISDGSASGPSSATGDYGTLQVTLDESYRMYQKWLEDMLLSALGIFDGSQFDAIIDDYIRHVRHFVEDEQVYHRPTDTYRDPDESLMQEFEDMINVSRGPADFRDEIMNRLAAYQLEHGDDTFDYREVFPEYFETFRRSFLQDRREDIYRSYKRALSYLSKADHSLTPSELEEVESTLDTLRSEYGFCDHCLKEGIGLTVQKWEDSLDG
jgi:predicted Ser/Thr protein kinase